MGRKYLYYCDGCGIPFGDTSHLNVKRLCLYESHKVDGKWR